MIHIGYIPMKDCW